MSGWVRGQFEANYAAASLEAPPRGKLEDYAHRILDETSRYGSDVVDDEVQTARSAMAAAAAALLEFAGRGRPRKSRYASPAAPAPKPSSISIRNRTAAIRARYGRQS